MFLAFLGVFFSENLHCSGSFIIKLAIINVLHWKKILNFVILKNLNFTRFNLSIDYIIFCHCTKYNKVKILDFRYILIDTTDTPFLFSSCLAIGENCKKWLQNTGISTATNCWWARRCWGRRLGARGCTAAASTAPS